MVVFNRQTEQKILLTSKQHLFAEELRLGSVDKMVAPLLIIVGLASRTSNTKEFSCNPETTSTDRKRVLLI